MKASREEQLILLDLQATDLKVSRLRHSIDSDPRREKLAELEGRADDLRRSVIAQKAALTDRQRKIAVVEDDVEKVRARAQVQQGRLDSGKIGIRDMGAVEHEIKKIRERKEELEMQVLELQDELDEHRQFLLQTEQAYAALTTDEESTRAELKRALEEPTAQLAAAQSYSKELRAKLPGPLVAEYDRLRSYVGPLAILRFEDGALVNAPVEFSLEELSDLRRAPEDELWESEEWGYAVVRV